MNNTIRITVVTAVAGAMIVGGIACASLGNIDNTAVESEPILSVDDNLTYPVGTEADTAVAENRINDLTIDALHTEVNEITARNIAEAIETAKAEAEQNAGTVTANNGGNAKASSNKASGNTNSNTGGNTNGNTASTNNASAPAATGNAQASASAPVANNGGGTPAPAQETASAPAPAPAPAPEAAPAPAPAPAYTVGSDAVDMSVFDLPPVEVTEVQTSGGSGSTGGGGWEAPHTETVQVGTTSDGEAVYADVGVGGN